MSTAAHGKSSDQRLVIIGCGYVGAAVAEYALAQGVEVTALTRNHGTAAALRAGGITAVVADVTTESWYDIIPGRPDFLLNCLSGGGGGLEGYRHSYLRGMESVLHWARTRGAAGTCVYTSSTSVYPQDGGVVVDETAATNTDSGGRAQVLLETEKRLTSATAAFDRWFILRLAGIYGPGRHHLLEQVQGGTVAGTGAHHLNLAHRDDIVAAIWACFTAPPAVRNEIFNVADDGPATKREITGWLAAQLAIPAPAFTGAPTPGRRAVTPDRLIANRKLKTTLGWAPHFASYREGYAALLRR